MGLENLKSIFAEGAGNNNSQISNRYVDISAYPRQNVEAVNFFGPENSYSPPLEKPIEGFTLNFNQSGYAVGDGFLGDSNLINVTSNFETRRIEINTENLTSNQIVQQRFPGSVGWGKVDKPELKKQAGFRPDAKI